MTSVAIAHFGTICTVYLRLRFAFSSLRSRVYNPAIVSSVLHLLKESRLPWRMNAGKAIEMAFAQIEKQFGKRSIMRLGVEGSDRSPSR